MIYSISNEYMVIVERTENEAKLAVYLDQIFKNLKNEKMDTNKIDKMIREIEGCNKKIDNYINNPSLANHRDICKTKDGMIKILKSVLWVAAPTAPFAAKGHMIIATIVGLVFGTPLMLNLSNNSFYNKLKAENNKALNWLKKKKEDIRKTNLNHENTIFESVSLI